VSAQGAPESRLTHVCGEARVPQFPGILVALLTAAMIFIYLHCVYIFIGVIVQIIFDF
jgi:hypothetical protein